jgi:CD109 antigen
MESDSVMDSVSGQVAFSAPAAPSAVNSGGPVMRKSGEAKPVIQIRKEFPETWLFENLDFDNETTQFNLVKKVPDTITSWVITAFAVDPLTGMGVVESPSKFKVFQPFFVTTNLPYSIKRGEVVTIPVLVFNYMDSDQEVEVTFLNSEREFEFAEVNEAENNVGRKRRMADEKRTKTVFVASSVGVSVPFMIRPLKNGHITIKVR